MVEIVNSNIVTQFNNQTIGTKVLEKFAFVAELKRIVGEHTFPTQEDEDADRALPEDERQGIVKGVAFIPTPTLVPYVSSGDAPRPEGTLLETPALDFVRTVAKSGELVGAAEIRDTARLAKGKQLLMGSQVPAGFVEREYRGENMAFLQRDSVENPAPGFCAVVVDTVEAYLRDPDVLEEPGEYERIKKLADEGATHVLVAVLGSQGPKPQLTPYRFMMNCAGGNLAHLNKSGKALQEEAQAVLDYAQAWVTVAD